VERRRVGDGFVSWRLGIGRRDGGGETRNLGTDRGEGALSVTSGIDDALRWRRQLLDFSTRADEAVPERRAGQRQHARDAGQPAQTTIQTWSSATTGAGRRLVDRAFVHKDLLEGVCCACHRSGRALA